MIVLGGILVPLSDLPRLTQPLAAAMPSRWAFEGMVVPEALRRPRVRPMPTNAPPPDAAPPRPSASQPALLDAPAAVPPVRHDETRSAPRRRTRASLAVAQPGAMPAGGASGGGIVTVADQGRGRSFLLPGRRRIAEALEDAAEKAEAEMQQAKQDAERKAQAMKEQMRQEVEGRGTEMQSRMQTEMEKRLQAARADFDKQSAGMNATLQKTVEARVQEATQSFEARLRDMQQGMEQERQRMKTQLDQLGSLAAQTRREIVPAATAPAGDDIDMAERFFSRSGWRSSAGVPLAVLGGMFIAGIVATGIMLVRRDAAGR